MLAKINSSMNLWVAAAVCVYCSTCKGADLTELMRRWENPKSPYLAATDQEPSGAYLRVAAEASPDRMRKVRAEYMNSSQLMAYFRSGGDMAILPLGSVEMHGSHGPLTTKTLIAHATAILLAEQWNALVFPPIRYSYVGATERWPGTVSISIEDTIAYTRAVVESILAGGFKRLVLLAADDSFKIHGPFLVNSIHRQLGELPLYCEINLLPNSEEIAEELGYEAADDIRVMAALKILGHPNVLKPGQLKCENTTAVSEFARICGKLREADVRVPPVLEAAVDRMPLRDVITKTDVDKAIAIMRREAKKREKFPVHFAQYQKDVRSQLESGPWSIENYPKFVEPPKTETKAGTFERTTQGEHPAGQIVEKDNTDYQIPLSSLPVEATPEQKRQLRAEFMSAAQIAEKLKRGEDMAILPVGAFEMHGPHGLLDTDTIQAYCWAIVLASQWKAVVMPPIHYVHTGATEFWAGTVSVSAEATVRYVRAVAAGLLDAGFKRVVLLWFHYPGLLMGQQVARDLHRQRGSAVFALGFEFFFASETGQRLGYRYGEDIGTLAGVKILGHPGVFVVDEPEDIPGKWDAQPGWQLRKMGVAGRAWYMTHSTQHLHVRSCVKSGDEDKLIDFLREVSKRHANLPEVMTEYLAELKKLKKRPPWKWENWEMPASK